MNFNRPYICHKVVHIVPTPRAKLELVPDGVSPSGLPVTAGPGGTDKCYFCCFRTWTRIGKGTTGTNSIDLYDYFD